MILQNPIVLIINSNVHLQSSNSKAKSSRQKANTSNDLIDDTTLFESDSPNNTVQHSTRSRKQQIVMNSDNENDSSSQSVPDEENGQTVDVTVVPVTEGGDENVLEKSEYDFEDSNPGPSETAPNDRPAETTTVAAAELDGGVKRGRGGRISATKSSPVVRARDSEGSPPRKSARIANKQV